MAKLQGGGGRARRGYWHAKRAGAPLYWNRHYKAPKSPSDVKNKMKNRQKKKTLW